MLDHQLVPGEAGFLTKSLFCSFALMRNTGPHHTNLSLFPLAALGAGQLSSWVEGDPADRQWGDLEQHLVHLLR